MKKSKLLILVLLILLTPNLINYEDIYSEDEENVLEIKNIPPKTKYI